MKLTAIVLVTVVGLVLTGCGGGDGGGSEGGNGIGSAGSTGGNGSGGSGNNGNGGTGGNGDGNTGGGSNSPPIAETAAGFYMGSVSNTPDAAYWDILIFEDDTYYIRYARPLPTGAVGFITGQGESKNGSFTTTDAHDYHRSGVSTGTISISYKLTPANTKLLQGTLTYDAPSQVVDSFTGDSYFGSYDVKPVIANLVGSYQGTILTQQLQQSIELVVDSAGLITGSTVAIASGFSSPTLCTLTGSIKPKSAGNAFDTIITFGGGSTCANDGQTLSGIAIYEGRGIQVMATSKDKTVGALVSVALPIDN